MKKMIKPNACRLLTICLFLPFSQFLWAAPHGDHEDDPLLALVNIDQFEVRDADDENPLVLEGQAWVGYDLDKLWLKAEVERALTENR